MMTPIYDELAILPAEVVPMSDRYPVLRDIPRGYAWYYFDDERAAIRKRQKVVVTPEHLRLDHIVDVYDELEPHQYYRPLQNL